MNSDISKAIYALLTFLVGRLVYETSKSYYRKFSMLRQLQYELKQAQFQIGSNRQQIEKLGVDSPSWPLLSLLDLTMHTNQLAHIITNPTLSKAAQTFITHCKHYNRIIENGDEGVFHEKCNGDEKKKKKNVIQQGALLYNIPEFIFMQDQQTGNKIDTYKGHSEKYNDILTNLISKQWKKFRWIPWFSLIFLQGSTDIFHNDSHEA